MSRVHVLLGAAAIAAGLLWTPADAAAKQASKSKSESAALPPGNPAKGATVYKQQCAACHGADLSGNTAMGKTFKIQSLKSPAVQNLSNEQLFNIISNGKGKMPSYSRLGAATIKDLVAYLRQQGKAAGGGTAGNASSNANKQQQK